MAVFAISGWKKSGKDTVASYLVNEHKFEQLSFAEPLKKMTAEKYGLDLKYMYEQELKELPLLEFPVNPKDDYSFMICKHFIDQYTNIVGQKLTGEEQLKALDLIRNKVSPVGLYWTPRTLMILEGSTARSVDSNFWVTQALKKVDPDKNYVISDLRYRNEADTIKSFCEKNGIKHVIARIDRFDSVDTYDPSERDLDDYNFKYRIENKSTLESLYVKVEDLLFGIPHAQ